ncbi:exported protein of unknown function [Paraburkholderia kururiensis]|jgi:hypothetical protein|uniref:hypothetical protein n=1 Tax=Paraburkholderia kururiensis TaxID=984307 RepID=UPI000B301AC1|nr:hypothetical protein [Paraburkholderia kururiensis]
MKSIVPALLITAGLAACASSQDSAAAAHLNGTRVVDFAGSTCGNPNMHVKMPVCLFPRVRP